MWQPKNLLIKNLMTHVDTEFSFKENNSIMLFSRNLTDSGADSNGGGKSTILEGITLAVTGETNRGVKKDVFITDGEDDCYIELNLENNIGDIKSLSIQRWFYRNKSSKIKLIENGKENKEMTSVNEANKRVYELIGLSRDDLVHFFLIGQETSYSFLTANDTDKKSIISRFSDITFIDSKIEEIKQSRKEKSDELVEINSLSEKCLNRVEFINDEISELKENFEARREQELLTLENNLKKYQKEDEDINKKLTNLDVEIKKINSDLSKLKAVDLSKIRNKINEFEDEILSSEKHLRTRKHHLSHFKSIEDGKISCPKCKFDFNPNQEITIEELPKLRDDVNKAIKKTEKLIKKLTIELSKEKAKLKSQRVDNDRIDDLLLDLKSKNRDKKSQENDLTFNSKRVKRLKREIKELREKGIEDDLKRFEDDLKLQNQSLKDLDKLRKIADDDILDFDFWIHHFGKKGFLTFLTNKSIKSIEGVTNSYLKKMNSDLQILIDGYTILKSGDVREKINISIIRDGVEIADFNRFSGGEKGRIKLANILGLQHLINLNAKNGGLNFLGLDEVFEGLDQTGQIDVIKILENLKVTSLVITHRNQPMGVKNEMFIEKINGISKLIEE